ncbi:protein unc-93 homolog A-like [Amphiura filiformis]|uniref:protein unc-93 homolog A-like n=1 Tax=Amphiura filiformis TaxID=82378 RepID=UPI003B20CE30
MSLQNLASSLYATGGLGLASFATIYCFYAISCPVAPVVIRFLGTKWVIVAACCTYCVYIAMNFYPTYYTLIPAAVLMGMGTGPLWSSQGTHLTTSAMNLADIISETHEAVISRFNGVFFFFNLASQIPGNLVSSLVLFSGVNGGTSNDTDLSSCGANDCGAVPVANSSGSNTPDQTTLYILFGTLLAWGTLSIPMAAFFMNPLPSYCPVLPAKRSALEQLKATFRLALSPRMFLLIPLIIYNGMELGFASGDFTKAYISCTQGVQTIGFVMTAYGIGGGISALFLGIINKYTGRLPIFTVGFLSQMVLITMMLFWDPYHGQLWHLYLMAVALTFGGVLRESQLAGALSDPNLYITCVKV